MTVNPFTLCTTSSALFAGISLGTSAQPSNEQVGLWIACMISVLGSITALILAYRTLTKNFVTQDQLQVEIGKLLMSVEMGLKESRHDVAEKVNSAKLQLEVKLDNTTATLTENARLLGRIEGLLEVRRREGTI